jgi:pimeloyl-ACP methyl ester carboxylesterase
VSAEPRPAPIQVPQTVLDDLAERLARTRWAEPVPGTGWEAGADVDYVRDLCAYWRDGYDWRAQEAALNGYPLYAVEVDGVELHFWWVRGKGPSPVPLLLLHGWPGSIVEFQHLIEPLTDPAASGGDQADSFDVVIASLPGYGFGGKPQERGWGPTRCAEAFNTLMTERLGYDRFGTQGGDWGALITSKLGSAHPESVLGVHLNFALGGDQVDLEAAERSGDEAARRAAAVRKAFAAEEGGYGAVQGTKPVSLGIAQADSPAGLAAWIVEKFRSWSDWDDDFESLFSRDTLLTNLMFYWAPNSIASAARLYYERRRDPGARDYPRVEPPTALAVFPKELLPVTREWMEEVYNLVRWTEMARGGHFAALEQPELLLEDIRAFFRELR